MGFSRAVAYRGSCADTACCLGYVFTHLTASELSGKALRFTSEVPPSNGLSAESLRVLWSVRILYSCSREQIRTLKHSSKLLVR